MRMWIWSSLVVTFSGCPSDCDGGGGGGGATTSARDDNLASHAGDFALDYLRDDDFDSLRVEIDHVVGKAPRSAALDALQVALETYLDKPGGVIIDVDDAIPDPGVSRWTYDAAEDLEIAHRDHYHDAASRQAVMYLLYLGGSSDRDTGSGKVLGYAYHGSSIVMFKDTITGAGSGLPLISGDIEPTVIVHEAGHLLGLVDNGIGMVHDHADPSHPAHDASEDCIMYWAADTDSVVDMLLSGGVPGFDAACEADMAAARAP